MGIRHRTFKGASVVNLGINGDSLSDSLHFMNRQLIHMKLQPTFLFILIDGGEDLAKYVGRACITRSA